MSSTRSCRPVIPARLPTDDCHPWPSGADGDKRLDGSKYELEVEIVDYH